MSEKSKISDAGNGDAKPEGDAPRPGGVAPDAGEDVPGTAATAEPNTEKAKAAPEEVGGRGGLDPTRYGDWEVKGRCIDF